MLGSVLSRIQTSVDSTFCSSIVRGASRDQPSIELQCDPFSEINDLGTEVWHGTEIGR